MLSKVSFNSIFDGMSSAQYFGSENSYQSSIAIDPDMPVGSQVKASGCLVPVVYEEFSGANITGYPKWIVTNIKNSLIYTYSSDGKVVSYSASLGDETLVGTPTSGAGNGAIYYRNYIYFATTVDISRYGPLDGTPALTNTVWTGATLGSQTTLVNTTYPTLSGVQLPNHPMYVHSDNSLYFADVLTGGGILHKIKTTKSTAEGDTNNGSAYNVLDLPQGWFITDIDAWGLDIAILAVQGTSATIEQGKAALFIWETTNTDTFYRGPIFLPDPLATSLMNVNGRLYIWSGNAVAGCRLSEYIGGDMISEVAFIEDGIPPMAGACDANGGRIAWANKTTTPEASVSVLGFGSKSSKIKKAVHNIARTTSAGANGICTSLKYVQQGSTTTKMILGWGDDSAKGIDKYSTSGTYDSIFRTKVVNVGAKFTIDRIKIPLGAALAANMSLVVKIYYDDEVSSKTLTTINTTNFTAGTREIIFTQQNILDSSITPRNNFFLEFSWGGSVKLPLLLPIEVVVDIAEDEGND